MVPSVSHAAPRPSLASQIVCALPPGSAEFLQLPVGEEAEVGTVGRPEWIAAVVGPCERLRGKRVEPASPDLSLALCARRSDRERRSVGGKSQRRPRPGSRASFSAEAGSPHVDGSALTAAAERSRRRRWPR